VVSKTLTIELKLNSDPEVWSFVHLGSLSIGPQLILHLSISFLSGQLRSVPGGTGTGAGAGAGDGAAAGAGAGAAAAAGDGDGAGISILDVGYLTKHNSNKQKRKIHTL